MQNLVLQIDTKSSTLWYGGPYSYEHLLQGTSILVSNLIGVKLRHENWDKAMQLKGGICAYSCGVDNVKNYTTMDNATTNNDFSNDVAAHSQFYKDKGF